MHKLGNLFDRLQYSYNVVQSIQAIAILNLTHFYRHNYDKQNLGFGTKDTILRRFSDPSFGTIYV